MKTIIIAGGSGFLGKSLNIYFTNKGYLVKILTRTVKHVNDIYWNGKDIGDWCRALENASILINLAGKSVDCRYTSKNKKEIYDSRIQSTQVLGLAINLCKRPPKVWMNSSTATIYKHCLTKKMTEENGDIGNDFSMNIAKSWEHTFNSINNPKTRKIILRTSIVLGKKGGALIPLKKLTKLGLGGKQGSGKQKVSWIHESDFARAIEFLFNHTNLKGTFNMSAPEPTHNAHLMKCLRESIKIPFGMSHSIPFLKLGAKLIGTETELVLKSRNVIPKKLLDKGFSFQFSTIDPAINELINY